MPEAMGQDWVKWAGVLILGFPLGILILNELIIRYRRQHRPIVEPLCILRNLVLPILAGLILLTQVLELSPESSGVRLVTTLLWVAGIYGALSGLKVLMFQEAKATSWQARVPDLVLDLGQFFLIASGLTIILSTVWQINLGGLLTALGVGSLVIGLALQDALKNLFSGILLLFERPFGLGDWLKVGDQIGQVIQVNWRSVYLETKGRELVVIPNSTLAQGSFNNLSRPTNLLVAIVVLRFSYDDPPNRVKQILRQTALGTEGVLADPEPWAVTVSYDDFYITYKVGLFVEGYDQFLKCQFEFTSRVWYAAKRHGLTIPYPTRLEYQLDSADLAPTKATVKLGEALQVLPNVGTLNPEVLAQSNQSTRLHYYSQGEWVLREGDRVSGLHLILRGQVVVLLQHTSGEMQEINRLSQGEFFGEKALMAGETSDVGVIASEDLEIVILEPEIVALLLERIPMLGREIYEIIALRQQSVQATQQSSSPV
ncbi:MAG: mechanosensitive ion channel [Oscillatoriales cyanobacterium RM1_1_9]|nr:mechanosensitive ion channel [Oscillatoriales cyanobacterium SM2_3_0]NJO46693.1 mechanosensitive ion channel [Oscillatoriales cyanobacterium RM2_1_1]NJO71101.1 mechanosensitive ion channel [Oscillatoriales cyanobacterium RM1_1_9]